ncbi:hypothetical protein DTO027B5_5503 [Paecilomyces variotii]|nr:hypothetical protein DTO032I3_7586 [Paecilomyces variotii]KAJ9274228.1 hypothetical protein DTO021D3_8940 [Paecilomyces variotii]KAJ9305973.1 hypothetical protein DTO217A2_4579 [Paecilomyces variotii]KAJ9321230.1 hypothetical protein DTO027B3_7711 [Paecilomyces variotii]KAJ9332719.1 hypothetical protein DTO027B5_5503 [Paecilomyces variotii]
MHLLSPLLPLPLLLLCLLSLLISPTNANTEKTIFIAPQPLPVPSQQAAIDDLGLERLSPEAPVLRTYLNASFPTEEAPLGSESWFFLEDLNPGQRYEVRVCWLATQPTSFHLTAYTLSSILEDDPTLLSSITAFSSSRLSSLEAIKPSSQDDTLVSFSDPSHAPPSTSSASPKDSVLFLRIYAAADYFTLDEGLMRSPPPVLVDLILDPYLLNVFPRSLVPTAGWVIVVAGVSWVVGGFVVRLVQGIAREAEKNEEEGKKRR